MDCLDSPPSLVGWILLCHLDVYPARDQTLQNSQDSEILTHSDIDMTWVEFPRKINHRPLLNAISAIVEATNLIYRINHFPQLHIHHLDRYSTGENTRTIHIVICPARDSSIVHAFLRCNMGLRHASPFSEISIHPCFPPPKMALDYALRP